MDVGKPWWFNIFDNDSTVITNYFVSTENYEWSRPRRKSNVKELKREKELHLTFVIFPSAPLRLDPGVLWALECNYWNFVLLKIYFLNVSEANYKRNLETYLKQ